MTNSRCCLQVFKSVMNDVDVRINTRNLAAGDALLMDVLPTIAEDERMVMLQRTTSHFYQHLGFHESSGID